MAQFLEVCGDAAMEQLVNFPTQPSEALRKSEEQDWEADGQSKPTVFTKGLDDLTRPINR